MQRLCLLLSYCVYCVRCSGFSEAYGGVYPALAVDAEFFVLAFMYPLVQTFNQHIQTGAQDI